MIKYKTLTGEICIQIEKCHQCEGKPCIDSCPQKIFKEENGKPVLGIESEMVAKGKCIECLACELECQHSGNGAMVISLPLPELK